MPALRGEDQARNGDTWTGRMRVRAVAMPHGRPPTSTETQRRYRRGIRVGAGSQSVLIWAEPPVNGRPFRPYVYRGTGADAYTGEVVQ